MIQSDIILNSAREIALEAGKILREGFYSPDKAITFKSRTDLVTNFDFKSEKYICSEITSRFPEHSIVAEEGGSREGTGEYRWYIDPLDATNNFAHGIPFFCVSIGVYSVSMNSMYCGVVYDPVHEETFYALKGNGSYCNEKNLRVSDNPDIGTAMLATGFPYCKDDMENNNLNLFNKFLPKIQGIRRLGSAALDLCFLAAGRIDGYWEPMLKPWDTAAGSLIVQEAGGTVTKFNGDRFDPEYPEVLASNGRLHDKMITILNS